VTAASPAGPTDLLALFDDLVHLHREVWNGVDVRMRRECGVPAEWYRCVDSVASRDGSRVADVATDLVLTIGAAAALVDRVVEAGFVTRGPHPVDGRSSVLMLGETGERLLTRCRTAIAREIGDGLAGGLTEAGLARFAAMLGHLRQHVPAVVAPAPPR